MLFGLLLLCVLCDGGGGELGHGREFEIVRGGRRYVSSPHPPNSISEERKKEMRKKSGKKNTGRLLFERNEEEERGEPGRFGSTGSARFTLKRKKKRENKEKWKRKSRK
ncbi:hypothetical protein Sjap_023415 [Stephania japonica]|uniref:Secreted protein n=1 Tax=Stephania japonica TaxID=461633 RepID=A0AAP0HIZ5_9MAGN